ncbi:NAD-specific glutamate dehydrogenase [Striga asiatica]|uniref:NAD-specific glutamate dehydrogenase n=1 Tax=Striga asiatica TaxID=4170 RepID=A0A5A7Q2Y3_STRAF|nr:NAD-specific glutamate dehydrogenase [Striga asiatica]
MRLSKSSPPRWVSPAVALTSNVPLSIVRIETSQAIGNGGSSGLIDDADDIEAGNGTGILGGLSLRVAKVGRDGDDGIPDMGGAQIGLLTKDCICGIHAGLVNGGFAYETLPVGESDI